jgi:serine/threonine protein kinase
MYNNDKCSDLWAIGVITYFLLSGYTPFEGANNLEEMQAIITANYNYDDQCWDGISDDAKNFIDRCLTIDDEKRITAKEALEHNWLVEDSGKDNDLLPNLRSNFNARRTFKRAVNLVTLSKHFGQSIKNNSSSNPEKVVEQEIKPINEGTEEVLETA